MASVSQASRPVGFVHWKTDYSPYLIELKEDLIPRLIEEVEASQNSGIEMGGLLMGSFPEAEAPTIRIEDFVRIERGAGGSQSFSLTGTERERFTSIRVRSFQDRAVAGGGLHGVGFYKTHLRTGGPELSEYDQQLLSAEFRQIYVALVVEAAAERNAQWFLALNGNLYPKPAVPTFRFALESLRALLVKRQVPAEFAKEEPARASSPALTEPPTVRRSVSVVPVFLAGLALVAGLYLRPLLPGSALDEWLPGTSDRLDLRTTGTQARGSSPYLRIRWNNRTPEIYKAKSATLTITDDIADRQIELSRSDLIFGEVAYERAGSQVVVTLTLRMPDTTTVSQSRAWPPMQPEK